MNHFSFSSLRFRLILLVLLAVIPALGLTFYTGLEQRRHAAEHVQSEAMQLARRVSAEHERLIEGTRQFLYMLAQLPQVLECDKSTCSRLFSELLKQYPHYLNIGAIGSDGNLLSSAIPFGRPLNLADRPYFQQALKTCKFAIGEYQIGRVVGKPVVNFGYPVIGETCNVTAVVFVALDLKWINQLAAQVQLPDGSTLTLIDHKGTILARHPEAEKWIGKIMPEASIVKTILAQGQGMAETMGLDGIQRLYTFTSVSNTAQTSGKVYIAIGIPNSEAFAQVDRILIRNLILFGLVALLALVAAWIVGDVLVLKHVNPIVSAAKQLSCGNLSARTGIAYGKGELSHLAQTFDEMAKSLEDHEARRIHAEEELRLNESRLESLLKLNQMSGASLQEIMNFALEETTRLTRSPIGYLAFMNEDETVLTMHAWSKTAMENCRISEKPILYPIETTGLWGEAVRQRKPVITNDYKAPNRCKKGYPEGHVELTRHMNLPIFKGNRIVIVAGVGNKPSEYDESDVRQLTLLMEGMWGIIQSKLAEEALQQSKKEWENTFAAMSDWVTVINLEGRILRTNLAGEGFTGMSAQKMVGQTCCLLTHGTEGPLPGCPFKKMLQTRQREVLEIQQPNESRWLMITVDPVFGKDGNLIAAVHIARDITEQKRAEEEMIALQEQLRQSQKMEAIGQLAGGIAHDFNNLLTVIKGYSQLSLIELKESDPLRSNIKEIQNASERAANLTRQILAFSRRQVLDTKVLDLNSILRDLDKMLRRVIGEDIELVTLLAEPLGRVKTDPGQIEQVIMNIAVNARDAMPNGGKLTIETANVELDEAYARRHIAVIPGPYVMLSVSDTGVGMTPELRDRVFEPFFTTKEKGTGLGLSMVYGIVKQSEGNIWVYSEPGHGTTFKIYLPGVDEPLEELRQKAAGMEFPQGRETVLIVEDDEAVRKLSGQILKRQGYTILEAENGYEALRLCEGQKEPIHLILTDVVMPEMSGRKLVERFKKLSVNFRVLYMSGYTDNAIARHGILEKGVNYIQKPFTPDGLARKVREVLDG